MSEQPEMVDVAGIPTPMTFEMGNRRVTKDEWDLALATGGATLRAACGGEGLPVGGTNAARARRLVAAGLTKAQVEDRYGWKARQQAERDEEGGR